MEILTIENKLREYQEDRKKLFTTSSFQTHSVVLLHILSKIEKNIPVFLSRMKHYLVLQLHQIA